MQEYPHVHHVHRLSKSNGCYTWCAVVCRRTFARFCRSVSAFSLQEHCILPFLRFSSGTAVGQYWMDPNGGHHGDAIAVHCDFESGGATCIQPNEEHRTSPVQQQRTHCASDTSGSKVHICLSACLHVCKLRMSV